MSKLKSPTKAPEQKNSRKKRSAGRPSNRDKRREELIGKATLLFNERGISGTSLSRLAGDLGIARASVYHYIESRDELVFQCYQAACETTARDLDAAERAGNGFEQVKAFVELTLTPDRPPVAVLTEVNSLNPDIASLVCEQNDSNISRLIRIIEAGEKDGSIRTIDARILSQSIGGMLAWTQLLPLWTYSRRDADIRRRATQALMDILTDGLSVDRSTPFETRLLATDSEDRFTNIFDPEQAAAMKYQIVLKTASILFNQNGVEATSIDQIADRIGVTKGVLYHYFDDKSDLIKQCYERSFELYDRFIRAAEGVDGNALDILQTNTHLNIQAQTSRVAPLMPQPGFGSLPPKVRKRLTQKARDQNQTLARMLDRAINDGIARPFQSGLITHICAGAIGWIPKWLPEDNSYKPFEIADKISDLFRFGLRAD